VEAQTFPNVPTTTQNVIRITSQISAGGDAERDAEAYPRYRALYPALRSVFNDGKTADQKSGA
jgi:hypothetical protein